MSFFYWIIAGYSIGFMIGKIADYFYWRWVKNSRISDEKLEQIRRAYR